MKTALFAATIVTALGVLIPINRAAASECTRVIGVSQTRNWYLAGAFETQVGIVSTEWELLAVGGGDLVTFADPLSPAFTHRIQSPCGIPPTRAVLNVSFQDYRTTTDAVITTYLLSAIANIRSHWPTIGRIDLVPIVGGPNHQTCPVSANHNVRATEMHPRMDAVIAVVVNGVDVFAGPDLLVSACSDFSDAHGHLTLSGSAFIAQAVAQFYAPPPEPIGPTSSAG